MTHFIRRVWVLLFAATLCGAASAAPAFPVKYSANSRYLVDQNNVPFPILGRTAWFITSLSVADYQTFINDTVARGHNAIELHVLNHDPRGNHPPFNGNGDLPFFTRLDGTAWNGALTYGTINNEAPDFTTPNEAFWSSVDGLLAYAESKGVLVFLFPAYVGFAGGNQGWMQELVANGPTKMQSYGAWIATRYKDQKNLVWMMGGDMGTAPHAFSAAQTSVENALLTGLKSVPGQQSVFFSAEWDSESIGTDQTSFGTSMTLNGAYSWTGKVNSHGRRAYARTPVEPAYLLEEPYDQEGPDGNSVNPSAIQPVRRFQWWGWLATIGGYISGNGFVWPFPSNWRDHLDTQGARDMARLNAFVGSVAWQDLVPSGLGGMRALVTTGGSSVSAADYVAAAATPDGTLLVAYIPPAHSGAITVDMGALSGSARARWFDPTSAAYADIGTGLANVGMRSFTPPGNNSAGQKDWVLVLDRVIVTAGPTISAIPDQVTTTNVPTAAIAFTISDKDTPVTSLALGKDSSNPTLVPITNIVFAGNGANRTVKVTPAAGQTGTATITVSVSDGKKNAAKNFTLTVGSALFVETNSSTNTAAITIPLVGIASPYPSVIDVSGITGVVSSVTVTLRGITHARMPDLDFLLVGPGGQGSVILSDAGSSRAVTGITLTLADGAAASLRRTRTIVSGTYQPLNLSARDTFASPAPAGPYGTSFAPFIGTDPNGTWSLYVVDDRSRSAGSIAEGWSIAITTAGVLARAGAPAAAAVPLHITSVVVVAGGNVQVTADGPAGVACALEASSDLVNWVQVDAQANPTGSVVFTDRTATEPSRFYRAVSMPQ